MNSKTNKSVEAVLLNATNALKAAGIKSARLDSELLLAHTLNCDRIGLIAKDSVSDSDLNSFLTLIKRRGSRVPVAYITGAKEFFGLEFNVTTDVLIPRPETERLVELAIAVAPQNSRILELGTGSGAIAIALKHHRNDLAITATDVSVAALDIAKQNTIKSDCEIEFIKSDLLDEIDSEFHLLIANLPYVPDSQEVSVETINEPQAALFSGPDGITHYRRLFSQLKHRSTRCYQLLIEAEPKQEELLQEMAIDSGYDLVSREHFTYYFQRHLQ